MNAFWIPIDVAVSHFTSVRSGLPFSTTYVASSAAVNAADVLRRVDRSGRDEQDVAGLERHRRLALDLILQQAFEDIDDLFARMRSAW